MNPCEPSPHPRGSSERVAMYEARIAAGLPLYHPEDSRDIIPHEDRGPIKPSEHDIKRCRTVDQAERFP